MIRLSDNNPDLLNDKSPLIGQRAKQRTLLLGILLGVLALLTLFSTAVCVFMLTTMEKSELESDRIREYLNSHVISYSDNCKFSPISCNDTQHFISNITSVMVVVAHPDDAAFSAGGTVALFTQKGIRVVYVLVTNGERGSQNRSQTPEELGPRRQQEQRHECKILGMCDDCVIFLNYPDGNVVNDDTLRRDLTLLVRTHQPDIVLTWNPAINNANYLHGLQHSDHQAVAASVFDVAYPRARDYWYWPEQIQGNITTWKIKEVWMFSWHWTGTLNDVAIDISDVIDTKVAALAAHECQISPEQAHQVVYNANGKLGRARGTDFSEWFIRVPMMP